MEPKKRVRVFDKYGRAVSSDICPPGGRIVVPFEAMDARAVHTQRAFLRDAGSRVLHRPSFAEAALGDGFEAIVSSQRSQSATEAARMPPSAHKPTPGLGDAVADGDPVEWAYRRRSAWLEDAWRGPASHVDDVDDMMGIQRADAPDDIQQMSLAAQTAYVSAFNQHMEENPDDGFAECDQAGRDAIEALGPQDSLADAVAHLERVRDAIHAEQKRKLSEAWRQR